MLTGDLSLLTVGCDVETGPPSCLELGPRPRGAPPPPWGSRQPKREAAGGCSRFLVGHPAQSSPLLTLAAATSIVTAGSDAGQRGTRPQSKKSAARLCDPGTDPHAELREAGWWFQE